MQKPPANNATKSHTKLPRTALTVSQENAIDALVIGKTDAETAALVGVNRVTVTRWRLYSPTFIAALNLRRAELWSIGAERLRALIPKALDALEAELGKADSPHRWKVALEVLALSPPKVADIGPTDATEIVRKIVEAQRNSTHCSLDDLLNEGKGLPPYEQHVAQAWQELEQFSQGEADEAIG